MAREAALEAMTASRTTGSEEGGSAHPGACLANSSPNLRASSGSGRRWRAGRGLPRPEPGAGSAGPGAAQRRRL